MTATGGGPGMSQGAQSSGVLAVGGPTNVSTNPPGRGYLSGFTLNTAAAAATLTITDSGNANAVLEKVTTAANANPLVIDYVRPLAYVGPLQYTLAGAGATAIVRFQ